MPVTVARILRDALGQLEALGPWGGQRWSLAGDGTGMGVTEEAAAAGGRSCCLGSNPEASRGRSSRGARPRAAMAFWKTPGGSRSGLRA